MGACRSHAGRAAVLVALAVVGSGCTGTVTQPPSIVAIEGVETCKVAKDPFNPYVVEWRGGDLTAFEALSNKGLVIVSYAACSLKLLAGCRAEGSYELNRTTPNRDRITIDSEQKLKAELPLGAVSLKGYVSAGKELRLDYVAVGVREATVRPALLEGECDGATHYVRSVTVGAWALDARTKETAGGGVSNSSMGGAGLDHGGSQAIVKRSGDVDGCMVNPQAESCRGVIRLGLAGLPGARSGLAAAGFGAGLGAAVEAPPIAELAAPELPGFKAADVELLRKLQLAKRADKNPALSAREKALAWNNVANYSKGELWAAAVARLGEWQRVGEAERTREAQIEKLGRQYTADRKKIEDILALDDEVVTRVQKEAYRREFDQAYTPHVKAIATYFAKKRGLLPRPAAPP
ncbi:MAG: flagellar protein FliT [Deltaproteobacteria bacterium]|nr:flagellar protein FliT [Deltaproteobacteria bacterium]